MTLAVALRVRPGVGFRLLPLVALVLATGCAAGPQPAMTTQARLAADLRDILGAEFPSTSYQRTRAQLQEMGPELDPVLVDLIEDRRTRTAARADALVLLADRRSPIALPMLSRALGYESEALRSAAVLGLSRLAPTSDDALELIRAATRDRSRRVRLNALQSLDIREVETIHALLERETDPEVRQVALQLLSLAEARGASLGADRRGALRTAGGEDDPQIVFRPATSDTTATVMVGDLRLELPAGRDIPLASGAIVVDNVVPAFFSPDRSAVVVESGDEIRVIDIATRESHSLGPGLAPRLIPFTQQFVFLREKPGIRTWSPVGLEMVYDVYRSSFEGTEVEHIGELRAWANEEKHLGQSPVRWMVVGESGEGFVLKAENLETFPLPAAVWGSGRSDEGTRRR